MAEGQVEGHWQKWLVGCAWQMADGRWQMAATIYYHASTTTTYAGCRVLYRFFYCVLGNPRRHICVYYAFCFFYLEL